MKVSFYDYTIDLSLNKIIVILSTQRYGKAHGILVS